MTGRVSGIALGDPVLDEGLQRERTSLAWTRTALGVAGNGLLVVVRNEQSLALLPTIGLGSLALVVTVVALVLGARRSRIQHQPAATLRRPTADVVVLGTLLVLLCAATTTALLLDALT